MPRPKGAGKADPRLGRISSRIIDEIAREYDAGQKERLFRRIRRLQAKAYKLALTDGGLESFGPEGPMGPPPCAVAAQVANQLAASEEIISRIRARDQETEAKAAALFTLLNGGVDEADDRRPTEIVIKYATSAKPTDGDST